MYNVLVSVKSNEFENKDYAKMSKENHRNNILALTKVNVRVLLQVWVVFEGRHTASSAKCD